MATNNRIPLIVLGGVLAIMAAATIWKMRSTDSTTSVLVTDASSQGSSLPSADMPPAARAAGVRLPMRPAEKSSTRSRQPTREQMLAHRKERTEKAARAYDTAPEPFASQPVEPAWSARTEQGLRKLADDAVFAQADAKPKDMQVECKSSMCEIKSQFASDREARDWTQIYMTNAASQVSLARVRFIPNADGSTQVRIYAYK